MDRRSFLARTAVAGAALTLGPGFWKTAFALPATPGTGPYGALGAADANGLSLPPGFTSRIVAITGQAAVAGAAYNWHGSPDGGATFAAPDGGWVYVSNAEGGSSNSGVGALRFDAAGNVVGTYPILVGSNHNCGGGATPWGTWLSCEEVSSTGQVYECDPFTPTTIADKPSQLRAAMGVRNHEAVAVDPQGQRLYLTEDSSSGRLYRFTPTNYPDLTTGTLEAAKRNFASGQEYVSGTLTWVPVANITTGYRGTDSSVFSGGEGIWYDEGFVYFSTKGDSRIWSLDCATGAYEVIHNPGNGSPLSGVDNVFVSPFSGDILVAEDGGSMDICLITPPDGGGNRTISRLLTVNGSSNSEICGPALSPDGTRLYFSSQRGYNSGSAPAGVPSGVGITYEVSGPFRVTREVEVSQGGPGGGAALAVGAAAAAVGGAVLLGRRDRGAPEADHVEPPSATTGA